MPICRPRTLLPLAAVLWACTIDDGAAPVPELPTGPAESTLPEGSICAGVSPELGYQIQVRQVGNAIEYAFPTTCAEAFRWCQQDLCGLVEANGSLSQVVAGLPLQCEIWSYTAPSSNWINRGVASEQVCQVWNKVRSVRRQPAMPACAPGFNLRQCVTDDRCYARTCPATCVGNACCEFDIYECT
jgi:hypothetical protein